jgi:hypothetical protein
MRVIGRIKGKITDMKLPMLHNADELEKLVEEIGFLPFFKNEINGYSVEECTPAGYWFVDGVDGPWEWKGQIASRRKVAYAKLFDKKAGYVSREWYPELANYRRNGQDFEDRYREGLSSYKDKELIDILRKKGSCLSVELKRLLNYGREGNSGFETAVTRLQMQTYITVQDFEYKLNRFGQPYGWGIARYAASGDWLGEDLVTASYDLDPYDSKEYIKKHLKSLLPQASEEQIEKLIR